MRQSKSISLFTLLFWSIFINSKKFFLISGISIVVVLIILFASIFPKTNLVIGVVNLDKGMNLQFSSEVLSFSNKIVEKLKSNGNSLIEFPNLGKSIESLNNGKISLIIYFPENYTLFTHLSNFSKNSNVKPRILIYANEKKFSKEIKLELFNAFSEMAETKIIPVEIVETITNRELPKSYILLSSLFIFIFIFSLLSSYNFGFYLINKKYDELLLSINQSFLPILLVLSILLSLALFIFNSIGLSIFSLITKQNPFFGYAYIPTEILFLSITASIIGYIISYIFKKHNLFTILSFILFFVHYLTFPMLDIDNIFPKILSYLFLSVQLEKNWYWILSLNINPISSINISILYLIISLFLLIMIFFIENLLRQKFIINKNIRKS